MTNQYYEATIDLHASTLKVEVVYETQVTEVENRSGREYFQWRLRRERGQEIPLDKIQVTPATGEVTKRTTTFITKLDGRLYAGLPLLHQRVPYVLPKVIVDLKKFREQKTEATNDQKRLLDYTIDGLESIVRGNADV